MSSLRKWKVLKRSSTITAMRRARAWGESGLPVLLDMYLYHHEVWVQVESYAREELHSSTQMLLALEATLLIHTRGINWNANNSMRQLFMEINGLGLPVALAAAGLGIDGGEMATTMEVEQVAAESGEVFAQHVTEDAAGPCSFTPATLVTTEHGTQAIGTLQVGEDVLAYNPKTHTMEEEPILHVWINHDHDLVDLTLTIIMPAQQGKRATKTSEVIHTNQKHPFFTKERGFLPVGQIKLGMHVLRANGTYGVVTGWKSVPGVRVMYNLEVAQDHTFTVGMGQWVVHNTCGGNDPSSPGGQPNPPEHPAGMTRNQFGKDVMKWGTGNDAARARIGQITEDEMRQAGVTPEMAQDWADFYREVMQANPSNPSAAGRADLMQWVADLLRGK